MSPMLLLYKQCLQVSLRGSVEIWHIFQSALLRTSTDVSTVDELSRNALRGTAQLPVCAYSLYEVSNILFDAYEAIYD